MIIIFNFSSAIRLSFTWVLFHFSKHPLLHKRRKMKTKEIVRLWLRSSRPTRSTRRLCCAGSAPKQRASAQSVENGLEFGFKSTWAAHAWLQTATFGNSAAALPLHALPLHAKKLQFANAVFSYGWIFPVQRFALPFSAHEKDAKHLFRCARLKSLIVRPTIMLYRQSRSVSVS